MTTPTAPAPRRTLVDRTDNWIDAFIELKMTEVNRIRVQVNPAEYDMYYSL